jgi:hypothetical protein
MQHIGANPWDKDFRRLCDKVRAAILATYDDRVQAGDKHIYYTDGMDMIGPGDQDCTVDGTHANDRGFKQYVDVLLLVLKKILGGT